MRALTETQFDTILERMRAQVSSWHAADDRRAIFLDCYSRMTANMLGAFGAGKFLDDAWVRMLLRVFAGHYFSALEDWERQRSGAPAAWGIAFEAARSPATWITRDLLLGVNAHINYDLALAVRELLQDDWADMDESARLCRFIDFSNVNAVIGTTIDEVQDEVLGPFNRLLIVADKALGPLDEWMISRLVSHWRDHVWRQARPKTIRNHCAIPLLCHSTSVPSPDFARCPTMRPATVLRQPGARRSWRRHAAARSNHLRVGGPGRVCACPHRPAPVWDA